MLNPTKILGHAWLAYVTATNERYEIRFHSNMNLGTEFDDSGNKIYKPILRTEFSARTVLDSNSSGDSIGCYR